MDKKILGVLGGIGPMSSAYFYKLVTEHTLATKDQEHLDIVISSKSSTPDRTAYILGESEENPLPVMIDECNKMVAFGAKVIAVTCNTAHYFYDGLQKAIDVPILNIGTLAVDYLIKHNIDAVGLMATTGTIKGGIYQSACENEGLKCLVPSEDDQELVMKLIYKDIKAGIKPNMEQFYTVAYKLKSQGAKAIILGCTELSLVKEAGILDESFIDPLEILAKASIEACGYKTKN
ncbi:MAG: amino acid racemase [Clostridia bacterium]